MDFTRIVDDLKRTLAMDGMVQFTGNSVRLNPIHMPEFDPVICGIILILFFVVISIAKKYAAGRLVIYILSMAGFAYAMYMVSKYFNGESMMVSGLSEFYRLIGAGMH